MADVDVLVVGAGPVGLTAAAELRRHGVDCRIVDRLAAPQPHAKAIGIVPRTLEVWDSMGLVDRALDEAVPHLGQLVFIDGKPRPRFELTLPPEVPYPFATLPQCTTEQLLTEHLAGFGTEVERSTELRSLEARPDEVEAVLAHADGRIEKLHARYVVGCDGAHSLVRKAAGLTFEGDAFPEQYMIGDVEVDWELPAGHSMRAVSLDDNGEMNDMVVCIPMPGVRRYWLSTLLPRAQATGEDDPSAPNGPSSDRRRAADRNSASSRPCSTGCPLRSRPPPRCAGRPSSGPATAWWTAIATAASSSPGTPRTSTRRSADRV